MPRKPLSWLGFALALIGHPGPLSAAERLRFQIPFLTPDKDFRCDGRLEESLWNQAYRTSAFLQTIPAENQPPSRNTEIYLFHDGRALHVGMRCRDPHPKEILKARFRRDEASQGHECVGFYLDPSGQAQRAVWIQVTARGDVSDGIFDLLHGNLSYSQDFNFRSATQIDASGWTAELVIPFSELPIPLQSSVQHWNFTAYRVVPRENLEFISLVPSNRASSDPKDLFAVMDLDHVEERSERA